MRKRTILLYIALFFVLKSFAQSFVFDDISYSIITSSINKTVSVTSGINSSGEIVIPSFVTIDDEEYKVTSIGENAFYGCLDLTKITISNNVTCIEDNSFYGCSRLTMITIPESVTNIGQYAFYGCSRLTTITIPESVTSIGYGAFIGCTGLTSVAIPESVTRIGDGAFAGCTGLTMITIPEEVITIGDYSFNGCSGLTTITIPNSVTSIGQYAFSGCTGLTTITIPESVTRIGDGAFSGCTGLTMITIPEEVITIGDYSFNGCSGLTTITIPNSVTSIGQYAFSGCTGLTSITIPKGVKKICHNAFSGCNGLASIYIPSSVVVIENDAFRNCYNLSSIVVDADNRYYDSRNDCNAIIESIDLEYYDEDYWNKGYYELDEIEGDGDYSHYYVKNRLIIGCNNTVIPIGVTEIDDEVFSGCTGLKSIVIPESVKNIGRRAFKGCTGLKDVFISEGVNNIGASAFEFCINLSSISIPSSVSYIRGETFKDCRSLEYVSISEGVRSISEGAFIRCSKLKGISIPSSVESVEAAAFSDCTNLEYVDFNEGLVYIGNRAFSFCSKLKSIYIPSTVTGIYYYAFLGCSGLESIIVDSNNKIYDSRDSCNAIIETADNIRISDYSFGWDWYPEYHWGLSGGYYYTSKDRLILGCMNSIIPESVTSLGDYAFYECVNLTSITIPEKVNQVGKAFEGCFNTILLVPENRLKDYDYLRVKLVAPIGTQIYKEVAISDAGYSTFYDSKYSYELPPDLKAIVVSGISNERLKYKLIGDGNDYGKIPAGTPVILKSNQTNKNTWMLKLTSNTTNYRGDNLLVGSDVDTITYTDNSCLFYKLSYGPKGTDLSNTLGWYWGAADGGAFKIEGNKACLAVPKLLDTRSIGYSMLGLPMNITDNKFEQQNQDVDMYDLLGRSLLSPIINEMIIINGRKSIIIE